MKGTKAINMVMRERRGQRRKNLPCVMYMERLANGTGKK